MSTQAAAPNGNTVKTVPTDVEVPQSEAEIDELRKEIDRLDAEILAAIKRRSEVSQIIGRTRMASGGPRLVHSREMKVLTVQRAGSGRPHSRDAAPAPGPRTPGPLAHALFTRERPHRMPLAVPMWPFAYVSALERDVLRVQVFLDPLGPALAAESGFLHTAERRCRVRDHSAVDADHS